LTQAASSDTVPDVAADDRAPPRRHRAGAAVQALLILFGTAVVVAPPLRGEMLIAPLVPGDGAATIRWAWDAGAMPIATGPYAGSYVVNGSLAALLLPALSHGAVLISARVAGCNSTPSLEG